mgnify:CR=1 FL=1
MPKNLVIVESPAKAKTIEKFLGEDYKVMSSFGHIRDLKKKNFGVDLETFQPEYEIPADKTKVVSDLRAQAKKVDTVWLASDEDREGEAISWHLAEVLKLDPARAKRIVFHEITKPAILSAIENPRNIDHNLVDAQQARRVLDRLVGFKLSPVLWRKVKPNLSAGRVQSVAVRLIVEREREIENFQSEMAYRVVANFVLPQSQEGEGATVLLRAELNKAFKTEAEAKAFLESCKNTEFIVESVVKRPTKRTPAPPFTTSTLQQEASRKLGFPVATTMRVAQSLYEAGWITYMRTDSMNLSQLCLNSCGPVIKSLMGEEYHHRHTYHTQAKGAQEAHEAIRPTDMSREKIDGTPQEKRLYSLIWKRTIASQMADAKLEKTVITITVGGREEVFQASGEVLLFDGFLKVYRESRDVENENENDEALLPPLSEGDVLGYADISARQRYSRQPMRYTEASLVHKMEELGIGRPSTYAPTISTIQQRKYVEKGDREGFLRTCDVLTLAQGEISASQVEERVGAEKGKLLPTDTGTVVNDFLTDNFPEILDYNFTANVEKDFDHVAEGKKEWTSLIQQFYGDFSPSVDRAMEERTELRVGEREIGIDPESGKPVKVRIGKFGPMVQIGVAGEDDKPRFATLPANLSMNTITLKEALKLFRLPRKLGEYEGELIEVNTGRFGPYVRHAGKFVSIPKGEDPLEISLERAVELIQEKRDSEEKSHLKSFDEEPEMEVRTGRYGPYIVYKGKNYRIPKNKAANAADLTLEECRKIVETPVKAKKK